MDLWKYFDITHREHVICNPTSVQKIQELIDLVRLDSGARVVEIAAGKGEFLLRLAEQYEVQGLGIDLSPYCITDAREKHLERIPEADLKFLEMDGADFEPDEEESFDLAACIGASWIFSGYRGTIQKLETLAAPGGWIVVGEPFWRQEPPPEYLQATSQERSSYGTHYQNGAAGNDLGLTLVYTLVSSRDDWDRYEGLQWYAAETWADKHPDDPDVTEVLQRVRINKEHYLRWGRQTLGWAVYVFQKNARGS